MVAQEVRWWRLEAGVGAGGNTHNKTPNILSKMPVYIYFHTDIVL